VLLYGNAISEVFVQSARFLIYVIAFLGGLLPYLVVYNFAAGKLPKFQDYSFLHGSVKVQDLLQSVFVIAHPHVLERQVAMGQMRRYLAEVGAC
jgi:hypothetical protein